MADPRESVVNRLLDRISELADEISPQVEAETRRVFRHDNVQQTSSSSVTSTSSTSSTPSFVLPQNENRSTREAEVALQPTPPRVLPTSQTPNVSTQSSFTDSRRTFVPRRQFGGQRSNFASQRQRTRRARDLSRPKVADTRPFLRDLVLLSGPNDSVAPRQGSRLTLMEKGHIISGCRFHKAMNAAQVLLAIVEAY